MNPESRLKADVLAYDEGLDVSGATYMNLEHALSVIRDAFLFRKSLELRIFVKGQPRRLKPDAQEQIYLISREAMINAVCHSEATEVEAEVEYLPRRLRVAIRDNGCGIDPELVKAGKGRDWGLVAMQERAEAIGARLRVWSRPGAGTEVEISVPRHAAIACA